MAFNFDLKTKHLISRQSVVKSIFLVQLGIILIILGSSLPAISGQCKIEVGHGWIKGKADNFPLGDVLSQVAEKTGYAIYIAENLKKFPVTFHINKKLKPEKAIQRMIHPHSYAFVFSKGVNGNEFNILELQVFNRGMQSNTRYVALHGETSIIENRLARNKNRNNFKSFSSSTNAGTTAYEGRTIKGKNLLKQDFEVKKNIFGGPVVNFRDSSKGPDYRPNAREMRLAHEQYQRNKKQALIKTFRLSRYQARADHTEQQRQYRQQRFQVLNKNIQNKYTNLQK